MDTVREYLLRIISAALITAVLCTIAGNKSTTGRLLRLIGGIFLSITMIQPLIKFDWSVLTAFVEDYTLDAEVSAFQGEAMAQDEYRSIIKAQTEAYILDKAHAYGLDLDVEVSLSEEDLPVPDEVHIRGAASPYARSALTRMLETDLGIGRECQTWTG